MHPFCPAGPSCQRSNNDARCAASQLQQNGHGDASEGEGTIDDPDLLMQVMEARESVDGTDDAKELHTMQQENFEQQDSCLQVGEAVYKTKLRTVRHTEVHLNTSSCSGLLQYSKSLEVLTYYSKQLLVLAGAF